jgi:hypothetical protein
MPDLTTDQALALLQQIAQEELNWRNARVRVGELLHAAQAVRPLVGKKESLEADITRLDAEKVGIERSLSTLQGQVNDLKVTLRDAARVGKLTTVIVEREARLTELDAAVNAKQAALTKVMEDFKAFQAAHNLTNAG